MNEINDTVEKQASTLKTEIGQLTEILNIVENIQSKLHFVVHSSPQDDKKENAETQVTLSSLHHTVDRINREVNVIDNLVNQLTGS